MFLSASILEYLVLEHLFLISISLLFSGILYGVGVLGPVIAYLLGGFFSKIYVTLEGKRKLIHIFFFVY